MPTLFIPFRLPGIVILKVNVKEIKKMNMPIP